MEAPDLLTRLSQHRTIGAAPPEELTWLAAHGSLSHFDRGEFISRKGKPLESLYILLSGHLVIHVDRGAGPRRVMEWRGGDVSGILPYSRMTSPPGDAEIYEPADVFMVHREHFPAMLQHCPILTGILVHAMLDRAKVFTSSELHDEKMASLGRISAGLAHELNNPASAAARSAKVLTTALAEVEAASRALGAARLTEAQLTALDRVSTACVDAMPAALSPIDRADREEALASWLEAHGADPNAAGALVDTAVTTESLDSLASVLGEPALSTAVRWMAAGCTSRRLAMDVERATVRIHDLVAAVKRFTFMDRHQAPEAFDLAQGLRDSVALLLHKARKKSVGLAVDIEANLPPVRAIGSDLNQVWTNLIDNALDAVPEAGHVTVTAIRDRDRVVLRIVDDGPGIPAAIRERIFDPFFTTKPVGEGTGLGLEIARKLVRRNDGDIEVDSQPGRTEFRVILPVATDGSST